MITIQVPVCFRKSLEKLQRQIPEYSTIVHVDYFNVNEVVEMIIEIAPEITPIVATYLGYLAGKSQRETIVVKSEGIINATITTAITGNKRKMFKKAELVKVFLDELNKLSQDVPIEAKSQSKGEESDDN